MVRPSRAMSEAGSAAEHAIVQSAMPPFMSGFGIPSSQWPIGIDAMAECACAASAAGAMLIGIFCRSLKMCLTGKVEWRGTSYTHRMTTPVTDAKL